MRGCLYLNVPFGAMFPGMEYIPLVLMALLVGVLTGLLAVVTALLGFRFMSQASAGVCIPFSLVSAVVLLFLVGRNLDPRVYVFVAAPALLGWLSLRITRRQATASSGFRICDACGRKNACTTTICPRCMKRIERGTNASQHDLDITNPYHPPDNC